MKAVSARVANQQFSKLLAEVKAGAEVVITSRGTPVARLVPFRKQEDDAARRKAWDELRSIMKVGVRLGGPPYPSRDELHRRR